MEVELPTTLAAWYRIHDGVDEDRTPTRQLLGGLQHRARHAATAFDNHARSSRGGRAGPGSVPWGLKAAPRPGRGRVELGEA